MRVLCLDPSGNFKEGDGTTGWALFEDGQLKDFGRVVSSKYSHAELYWLNVCELIPDIGVNKVVCESYKLFNHKAKQQAWSEMETPQLIGCIRLWCMQEQVDIIFQDPAQKVRVTDPILVHMGILEQKGNRYYALGRSTVIHERDSIRHGVFFHRYNKEYLNRGEN
jgi:hypothetical protein